MSSNRKKNAPKPRSLDAMHVWMAPVTAGAPCGSDLEYDPEFVVLCSGVAARAGAQYGDFVGTPEPVNWSEVDQNCRRLMMRSKDMRLAVLFIRCRTRLAAAAGLAEGLALLSGWLAAFPDQIHPQPGVDEDRAAALEIRMNALQALTDTDGLIADLRDIALARSTAMRLQLRDIERAFAQPRPADALTPESVTRQLEELRMRHPDVLSGFDDALESLTAIEGWCREQLETCAPDLDALRRLLRHVARPAGSAPVQDASGDAGDGRPEGDDARAVGALPALDGQAADAVPERQASGAPGKTPDRQAALELIREARQWFEQHEPSSPIPVLLRRAEQCVGKRYAEIVGAIPVELLEQWEREA